MAGVSGVAIYLRAITAFAPRRRRWQHAWKKDSRTRNLRYHPHAHTRTFSRRYLSSRLVARHSLIALCRRCRLPLQRAPRARGHAHRAPHLHTQHTRATHLLYHTPTTLPYHATTYGVVCAGGRCVPTVHLQRTGTERRNVTALLPCTLPATTAAHARTLHRTH